MATDIFVGSEETIVEKAEDRYRRKPDGSSDQGRKED
jgi:hypothetical protein